MVKVKFNESNYENAIMELINNIGYEIVHGADIERDYKNPLYEDILVDSLHRLNPNLPESAIQDALQKLHNFDNNSLIKQNLVDCNC